MPTTNCASWLLVTPVVLGAPPAAGRSIRCPVRRDLLHTVLVASPGAPADGSTRRRSFHQVLVAPPGGCSTKSWLCSRGWLLYQALVAPPGAVCFTRSRRLHQRLAAPTGSGFRQALGVLPGVGCSARRRFLYTACSSMRLLFHQARVALPGAGCPPPQTPVAPPGAGCFTRLAPPCACCSTRRGLFHQARVAHPPDAGCSNGRWLLDAACSTMRLLFHQARSAQMGHACPPG